MRVHITKPLFAWECLEDNPSLVAIREALASVPDAKLLNALRERRGKVLSRAHRPPLTARLAPYTTTSTNRFSR